MEDLIQNQCINFDFEFTRYFINTTFSKNKTTLLPSDENTKSQKKKLLELAKEKFAVQDITPKEKFDGYEERFPMRPFYGEGIKKLPKVNLKTLTTDYESIFVNEQLSNAEEDQEIQNNNKFTGKYF